MATPRKHYFRVADSILREGWTDNQLATLVRLMAYLNQRWARDGLTAEEACHAVLSPADTMAVAGRLRLASARLALRYAVTSVSVRIVYRDAYTEIHWPKFSVFQGLPSEVGAKSGQSRGNSKPESRPLRNPLPLPQPQSESEAGRASKAARPPDGKPEAGAEPEAESEPAAPASGRGAWTPGPEDRAVIDFNALRLAARSVK